MTNTVEAQVDLPPLPCGVHWGVLEPVRRLLLDRRPDRPTAVRGLRVVFTAAFLFQLVSVLLVGVGVLLVAPSAQAGGLTGWVLLLLALTVPLAALLVAHRSARHGGKRGALAGAIALGGVLATPAWLALFLWATSGVAWQCITLGGLLALYYPLGLLLLPRYAGLATRPRLESEESASP